MSAHRLTHIGICVAELERSLHFYRDVLGFEEVSRLEMKGPVTERLLEIAGGELQAVYLKLDGTCIELLYYPVAGHETSATVRPMNLVGLTHLSLTVADIDAVIAAVAQAGGRPLDHTRIEHEGKSKAIFVTDPDGLRIELVQARGNANTLPGG